MVKHNATLRKSTGGKAQRVILGPVMGSDEEEFGPKARLPANNAAALVDQQGPGAQLLGKFVFPTVILGAYHAHSHRFPPPNRNPLSGIKVTRDQPGDSSARSQGKDGKALPEGDGGKRKMATRGGRRTRRKK
ncbi:hypothetical protein FRC11_014261 [Ceratobasidium sp. 423]|nr:hypothetical protein FRC11_014261 [Ceratobasidium sp. 423]